MSNPRQANLDEFREALVKEYSALAEDILRDPRLTEDINSDALDELINEYIEGDL